MAKENDPTMDAVMTALKNSPEAERQAFSAICDKTPDQITAEEYASIAPLLKRMREAAAGCTGFSCKLPPLVDTDGTPLPEDSAPVQLVLAVWEEASPEEKAAWHLFQCCMEMGNEKETALAIGLMHRWKTTLDALTAAATTAPD